MIELLERDATRPAAGKPDAKIVRLANRILRLHAEADRLAIESETLELAEANRMLVTQIHPLVRRLWRLRVKLVPLRATTMAGLRAKARVVRTFSTCADGYTEGCEEDALGWSLANDLLGLPSIMKVES